MSLRVTSIRVASETISAVVSRYRLLLFPFLAEISDVFNSENYMAWAVQRFQIVEEASGEYVNFEDSWVYSNTLGDA